MSATAVRRSVIGVILVAVVGWWAVSKMNDTPHYSSTPGHGAGLERTVLPPLDASAGGPLPLPDPGAGTAAAHYPAQPATVLKPPGPPPAVPATRAPNGPQDAPLSHQAGTGAAVHDPMPGTPSFDASIITDQLPLCDTACIQRVITQLGGILPGAPGLPGVPGLPGGLPVGG